MIEKVKFIPLTDDVLFKETFGRIQNILLIERFLEQYFHLPKGSLRGKVIVKMESTLEKGKYKDKNSRGDILLYLDDKIINLEVYRVFNKDSLDKSVFYSNRISGTSLEVGAEYSELKPFISINIVEKVEGLELSDELISNYRYQNEDGELTEKMEIVIIRLDMLKDEDYNVGEDEFKTTLRFIGAQTQEKRDYYAEEGGEYLMSVNYFLNGFMDDEFCNTMFTMENKIKETGIAEGKIQGKAEGKAEGKMEEKLEIAKSMLKKSDIDYVSEITGLSKKELKKLKKEMQEEITV